MRRKKVFKLIKLEKIPLWLSGVIIFLPLFCIPLIGALFAFWLIYRASQMSSQEREAEARRWLAKWAIAALVLLVFMGIYLWILAIALGYP